MVKESNPKIAVVMPAFNEAGGIADFLREIDAVFSEAGLFFSIFVQDDCSTDDTLSVLRELVLSNDNSLNVETNKKIWDTDGPQEMFSTEPLNLMLTGFFTWTVTGSTVPKICFAWCYGGCQVKDQLSEDELREMTLGFEER
jgi:glycosyltransferase involved in cell wall biosynthesis